MSSDELSLRRVDVRPARALHVAVDGTMYLGRRFEIHRSRDDGAAWSRVCAIPRSLRHRAVQASRIASRLMRQEVRAMVALPDGTIVAANRQSVYHAPPGETVMQHSRIEDAGQRICPPMTMTAGAAGCVLWGEYNSRNAHGLPIRIFVSCDAGRSYQIAHVFAAGEIRHVHSIKYDERGDCYWVLTGDTNAESGIGRLSEDLRDFAWLVRGAQCYRAVDAIDLGDTLLYGTDSGHERNAIVRLDKATGKHERVQELNSCCIHCCRCGDAFALSTTVANAPANRVGSATLWLSQDGDRWRQVLSAAKDRWHATYFQYGSIVLPRGMSQRKTLLLSGQALRGYDGRAYTAQL